jgi:hypothetical protein
MVTKTARRVAKTPRLFQSIVFLPLAAAVIQGVWLDVNRS